MAGENPGDRAGLTRLMRNRCAERAALEARRVKGGDDTHRERQSSTGKHRKTQRKSLKTRP